jgi:hypothetical protein
LREHIPIVRPQRARRTVWLLPDLPSEGARFASRSTTGPLARWNREGFQLLYLLFQMTVSEVPRVGVPSITIAK